jgi:hypothetical protein
VGKTRDFNVMKMIEQAAEAVNQLFKNTLYGENSKLIA